MQKIILITGLLLSTFACADEGALIIRSLDNDQACDANLHFSATEGVHTRCWLSGNWNQQIKPRFQLASRVVEGGSASNKSFSRYESTYIPKYQSNNIPK